MGRDVYYVDERDPKKVVAKLSHRGRALPYRLTTAQARHLADFLDSSSDEDIDNMIQGLRRAASLALDALDRSFNVKPHQVWEDLDKRANGRRIRILEIISKTHPVSGHEEKYVVCEIVPEMELNYALLQRRALLGHRESTSVVANETQLRRRTTIRLDRFRTYSKGFRLIHPTKGES